MSRILRWTLIAASLAGTASVAALGPRPASTPQALAPVTLPTAFDALDADHDGLLERSEVPSGAALAAVFTDHDHDGDGRLSRAEYEHYAVAATESADSD